MGPGRWGLGTFVRPSGTFVGTGVPGPAGTIEDVSNDVPVFTYGMLRAGFGDAALLAPAEHEPEPATLPGALMLDYQAYPIAVVTGETADRVSGVLVRLDPAAADETLAEVDEALGCAGLTSTGQFTRRRVRVETAGGEIVEAWAYLAADWVAYRLRAVLPVVASGDWSQQAADRPVSRRWHWTGASVQSSFRRADHGWEWWRQPAGHGVRR